MEAVNGVSEGDKGGPPPPSPLTGCYLLIVIGEPHCNEHKDIILQRVAKGLLSWDVNDCLVDLEKELAIITEQALEGEEARYGERLIQFASENLVTEILIHPVVSTLAQCVRNLLSSFTRHRHIIHAGYTFANNGSWVLQDGTFSATDFSEAFQEIEVLRVIRAYENGISLDLHCAPEGDWIRLPKESFTKGCKVRVNPNDVLTAGSPSISSFINYLEPFLVSAELENILESSDVVGNIRFSRPTLYVFPGGQGDAALFGINGFNMLLDGGFSRKACFWDFVRHLDRLDAVLLTRLNNSNVNGISAVLRRKKQNALYPQIGHFFCNIQERKAILSPDGDKDKDPLLINLLEEGQEIVSNLRHLSLIPQVCYRDSEPINLYHKVGHGTLDMYVLSPAKDSKEVREFLHKWNNNDQKLFANQKTNKDFSFPLQNLVSICALLVWQPANPEDTITRILFPGSSPQNKIFEGLDKIKSLDFIKHPVCSEKSLAPVSIIKAKQNVIERLIQPERKIPTDNKKDKAQKPPPEVIDTEMKNGEVNGVVPAEKGAPVKKSDSTESEKSISKPKKIMENGEKNEKTKPKPKSEPKPKPRSESQQRKIKTADKKPSPTTPKKQVEKTTDEPPKPKPKPSPSSTPAKSAKEANNRKVVESKIKAAPPRKELSRPPTEKKEVKVERKPISRRPKDISKLSGSPSKKVNGVQKPDSISRRGKLDKEGTTDSSTVSTPSAEQDTILKKDISKLTTDEIQNLKAQELADLKEEQEAVKEIEAVFRKGELQEDKPSDFRKIKDLSIDDKLESEEYLIIEKTEIVQEVVDENAKEEETQKIARDSEESEKQRKLSQEKEVEIENKREEIQDEVQKIITSATDIVKAKEEVVEASKEISVTSPEEKNDVSTDKKDLEEIKEIAQESQPDEKGSANIESGATTTAPTLPEDERMPLDEIKEDNGDQIIEEKHVKEDTKEKDVPVIQLPPKTFDNIAKLPPVVGIRLDKQSHMRDIVKTPDEVADLPVHEEVEFDHYDEYPSATETKSDLVEEVKKEESEKLKEDKKEQLKGDLEHDKDTKDKNEKDVIEEKVVKDVAVEKEKTDVVVKKEEIKTEVKSEIKTAEVETKLEITDKDTKAVISEDLNKKELSKSPDEEKDTDDLEEKQDETKDSKLSTETEPTKEIKEEKLDKESHEPTETKDNEKLLEKEVAAPLVKEMKDTEEIIEEKKDTIIEIKEEIAVKPEGIKESLKKDAEKIVEEKKDIVDEVKDEIPEKTDVKEKSTAVQENEKIAEEKKDTVNEIKVKEVEKTDGKENTLTQEAEKIIDKKTDVVNDIKEEIPEKTDSKEKTITQEAEKMVEEKKDALNEVKDEIVEKTDSKEKSTTQEPKKVIEEKKDEILDKNDTKRKSLTEDAEEKKDILNEIKDEMIEKTDSKEKSILQEAEKISEEKKDSINEVMEKTDSKDKSVTEQTEKIIEEKKDTVTEVKDQIMEKTDSKEKSLTQETGKIFEENKDTVSDAKDETLEKIDSKEKSTTQETEKIIQEKKESLNGEKEEILEKSESRKESLTEDQLKEEVIEKAETEVKEKDDFKKEIDSKPTAIDTTEKLDDLKNQLPDVPKNDIQLEKDTDKSAKDAKLQEEQKLAEDVSLIQKIDEKLQKLKEDQPEIIKSEIKLPETAIEPKKEDTELKEHVSTIEKIEEKLQQLKEDVQEEEIKAVSEIVTHKLEEPQHAEPVIITTDSLPESPGIEDKRIDDKMELGRKSPKEREEDVIKIVASVAEVLKSDAPLEEFEGKIPFTIPYKSYTTELRETHITTLESPVTDENKTVTKLEETVCPKTSSAYMIEEERKIAPIHEEPEIQESKISKMIKDSNELMQATSKIIQDIKQVQPKNDTILEEATKEEQDADSGTVHRMLVTASSEDGGEEIEICPPGTITFSKSSESSGRSSPDIHSQKVSQKSSIADTFSETTVITKSVAKDLQSSLESDAKEIEDKLNEIKDKAVSEEKDSPKSISQQKDEILEKTSTKDAEKIWEDLEKLNKDEKKDEEILMKKETDTTTLEAKKDKTASEKSKEKTEGEIDMAAVEAGILEALEKPTDKTIEKVEEKPKPVTDETGAVVEVFEKKTAKEKQIDLQLTEEKKGVKTAVEELKESLHKETIITIEAIKDSMKTVQDEVESQVESVTKDVEEKKSFLGGLVSDIGSSLLRDTTKLIEGAQKQVEDMKESAKARIDELKEDITTKKEELETNIEDLKQTVTTSFTDTIKDVSATAESKITETKDTLKKETEELVGKTQDIVDTTKAKVDAVKEAATKEKDVVLEATKEVIDASKAKVDDIKETVIKEKEDIVGTIKDVTEASKLTAEEVKENIVKEKETLFETAKEMETNVVSVAAAITEQVKSDVDTVKKNVEEEIKAAKDTVASQKEFASGVITNIKDTITQDVESKIEDLKKEVTDATDKAKVEVEDVCKVTTEKIDEKITDLKKEIEESSDKSKEVIEESKKALEEIKDSVMAKAATEVTNIENQAQTILEDIKTKEESITKAVADETKFAEEKFLEKKEKVEEKLEAFSEDLTTTETKLKDSVDGTLNEISSVKADVVDSIKDSDKDKKDPEKKYDVFNGLESVEKMVVDVLTADREDVLSQPEQKPIERKKSISEIVEKVETEVENIVDKGVAEVKEFVEETKEAITSIFKREASKEEFLEKSAQDLEENYEKVSDMAKSIVFEKCDGGTEEHEKIEKQLEKAAESLEKDYEVVSDMAKSIVFEKCETGTAEHEKIEKRLEKSAESLEKDYEVVSDMAKSIVFEKCDGGAEEHEKMEKQLEKSAESLEKDYEVVSDMAKSIVFEKCDGGAEEHEKMKKQLEKSVESLEKDYEVVSDMAKSIVFEKCEKSPTEEHKGASALEKKTEDFKENDKIVSESTKSIVSEKVDKSLNDLEKEGKKLEETVKDVEEHKNTVGETSQSIAIEKCDVVEQKSVKQEEKVVEEPKILENKLPSTDIADTKTNVDKLEDKSAVNAIEKSGSLKDSPVKSSGKSSPEKLHGTHEDLACKLSGKSSPALSNEIRDLTTEDSGKSTPDMKEIDHIKIDNQDSLLSGKSSPGLSGKSSPILSGRSSPGTKAESKDSLLSGKSTPEHTKPDSKESSLSGKSSPALSGDLKDKTSALSTEIKDSQSAKSTPVGSGKASPTLAEKSKNEKEKTENTLETESGKVSPALIDDLKSEVKLKTDSGKSSTSESGKASAEVKATEITKDAKDSVLAEETSDKKLQDVSDKEEKKTEKLASGKTSPEQIIDCKLDKAEATIELKTDKSDVKEEKLSDSSVKDISEKKETETNQESESTSVKQSDTIPEKKTEPEKDKTEFDTTAQKTLDIGGPQEKKLSISEVHVTVNIEKEKVNEKSTSDLSKSESPKETKLFDKKETKDVDSIDSGIDTEVESKVKKIDETPSEQTVKDQESTTKVMEMKECIAGPSIAIQESSLSPAKTSVEDLHLSGKSTPDIADIEKMKGIEENVDLEKHIPGSSTPPTVPVSPIVKDISSTQVEEIKTTSSTPIKSSVTSIKDSDIRSCTPGSDDYEIGASTHSDISSGQVSRAPHLLESERIESDDEDDVPGSPMSVTSQVPHSRSSSRYDFEDDRIGTKMDPMNTSFYGTLPDEEETELDFDKAMAEHRQTRGEDLVTAAEESPSYLYEITKAKYSARTPEPEVLSGQTQLDQINKNGTNNVMTASFMGDLPTSTSSSETKKDVLETWGKPLGLPSPAPPNDNRGTPKKERKLPANVSAKNKLNDDKKRSESPSKYKNKKINPVYVDLTYVPHHGNSYYSYVDFFKRVRARYYVFSGIEPSREVYNALLEAKQTWDDKELEVTIIPTYDTDILGYWVAENEELLTKHKIDLSPSASRCTINLQDHETSCSAYRLEF